jgi:signal transduction histidine kinase
VAVATATVAHWWRTVRAAGPRRLVYEGCLALGVAASTTAMTLASGQVAPALVVLSALCALVLVPLRLGYPGGTLLAAALVGVLTNTSGGVLRLVLSISAGYRMRGLARAALAFSGVLVGQVGQLWLWGAAPDWPILLLAVSGFLMIDLLPAVVAQMVSQRRQLLVAMDERNAYLRDQQTVIAERARARERDRIARELHDSLGNRLTLMSLYAGALRTTSGRHQESTLELLRLTSAAAMAELRQILGILHQSDQSDQSGVAEVSLSLDRLDELVDAARSTGTPITLERAGTPGTLPPIVEHAAYRTVQEGMTNALRHARGAAVRVTLRYEPDAVIVEVVNGPGAPHDAPTSGQGLIGLAERVRLAGGVLYHGQEPERGFRLAATLPSVARTPGSRPEPAGGPAPATDDVSYHLRRSARRSRTWLAALAAGLVVVMCGLSTVALGLAFLGQTVSRRTYDDLRVGQDEDQVRSLLPRSSEAVTDATGGPPTPAGASCVAYRAAAANLVGRSTVVYRFCFRDGTLVTKEALADGGR